MLSVFGDVMCVTSTIHLPLLAFCSSTTRPSATSTTAMAPAPTPTAITAPSKNIVKVSAVSDTDLVLYSLGRFYM